MPQMMPLNWMFLMIYFLMIFFMFNIFIYFISLKMKNYLKNKYSMKINWKW